MAIFLAGNDDATAISIVIIPRYVSHLNMMTFLLHL